MTPARTHPYFHAPACWAHHSWLESGRPVRHERTLRAAHAFLFDRYPQLRQALPADAPDALPGWSRPACARLCRIVASLALAPSLRRIVAASARTAFAASVAPRVLEALQRHPRAASRELTVEPMPSPFDRREMTALGLALAQQAGTGSGHAFWWSLRLPREIAQRALTYRTPHLTMADARDLLIDARRLMETTRC
nr:hypothetical protein HUO10_003575 [Paraburkholderia busanensis]